MRWILAAFSLFWLLLSSDARSAVHRFAVIVGNNEGASTDVTLRYAESDAAKMGRVLRELGGYPPENVVLLLGEQASAVEGALASVNARIRAAQSAPSNDVVLFVYYSGHADSRALRLGASRLELTRLAGLVRESSAKVRLLVVDACRSGALTRVKGGRIVAPFEVGDEVLAKEGIAFMTASSQDEDAQESDELKGSFFTHALVSGMLGAADDNRDGQVVLEEAYGHAYEATLRATSKTFAGAQHPTFRYDVRGQGSLVLTRLAASRGERGVLAFPSGVDFLVMKDGSEGEVVGEVGARHSARSLSLRPGRYFVRGRAKDALLEGTVSVMAGRHRAVQHDELERVEYARLVRKGGGQRRLAHGPEAGGQLRTALPNASTPCVGGHLGYRFELEWLSVNPRSTFCTSTFENEVVSAWTYEFGLGATASRVWDFSWSSIYGGLGLGGTLARQTFTTRGEAPPRLSLWANGSLVAGIMRPLAQRGYVAFEGAAEGHLLELQERSISDPRLLVAGALRLSLSLGVQL